MNRCLTSFVAACLHALCASSRLPRCGQLPTHTNIHPCSHELHFTLLAWIEAAAAGGFYIYREFDRRGYYCPCSASDTHHLPSLAFLFKLFYFLLSSVLNPFTRVRWNLFWHRPTVQNMYEPTRLDYTRLHWRYWLHSASLTILITLGFIDDIDYTRLDWWYWLHSASLMILITLGFIDDIDYTRLNWRYWLHSA